MAAGVPGSGALEADASRRSAAHARRLAAALGAAVVAVHMAMAVASMSPRPEMADTNIYLALANTLAQHGAYVETWRPDSRPHNHYPPMYPAVLAIMILAGAKAWSAFQALSVFCTGLATGFCFLWLRRRTGVWRAAALSLLFGIAPALLLVSQRILSEPMFLALMLASLWLLTPGAGSERRLEPRTGYLAAGLILVAAACFTRVAGLPLAAAAALCLAQDRRWRALAGFAALFALPAVLWRFAPGMSYVAGFRGNTDGPVDLFWRVGDNISRYAVEYVVEYVPGILTGVYGAFRMPAGYVPGSLMGVYGAFRMPAGLVGLALVGLALGGWLASMRRRPGVAEYFFALYAALVLLWPEVQRYALPLLPLILLYATDALAFLGRRLTEKGPGQFWGKTLGPGTSAGRKRLPARRILAAAAVVLVATLSVLSWGEAVRAARLCRTATERAGAYACAPVWAQGYHALSVWAGRHLPAGSIVLNRRPEMFHVLSGLRSRLLTRDNYSFFFARADSLGAGYVLKAASNSPRHDVVGYVDSLVAAHPHRFCRAAAFRQTDGLVVSLLAIKPPPEDAPSGPVRLEACPEWADRQQLPPSSPALLSMTVPLLDR